MLDKNSIEDKKVIRRIQSGEQRTVRSLKNIIRKFSGFLIT